MKYLIKTNDYASLESQDYNRIVYEEKEDSQKVFFSKAIGDYVDLGLPSGLRWAKYNLGASNEEEAGLYFQWGDTQGYTAEQVGKEKQFNSNYSDYKFGTSPNFAKYNSTDGKTTLDLEDDAVHAMMGGNWRMPTKDELIELVSGTDIYLVSNDNSEIQATITEEEGFPIYFTFTTTEKAKGIKFYKKSDHGVFLFVPASGRAYDGSMRGVGEYGNLWSSSLLESDSRRAFGFGVGAPDGVGGVASGGYRFNGYPVRGVLPK